MGRNYPLRPTGLSGEARTLIAYPLILIVNSIYDFMTTHFDLSYGIAKFNRANANSSR